MKKVIYTTYAPSTDMTFIMEDTCDSDNEIISTECIGWYHGEPDEDATKYYAEKRNLKAEYTL